VLIATCHCAAVRLEIEGELTTVTDCNCSICRRYGTLWAYFSPTRVVLTGALDTYQWGDRDLVFHRCRTCGCVTHWSAVDVTHDRMGINARLLPPEILATATVKPWDGASA
jgi:hypothetical protein